MRIQGFITDAKLPPIRQYKYVSSMFGLRILYSLCCSIPHNLNRLIDLKQSVTITGLGTKEFDTAVHGIQTLYQAFSNHVVRAGGRLRKWTPGRDNQDLMLTFANRYLTLSRNVGDEPSEDLSTTVDPFNVLRPILRGEVHTADNVVEYWERRGEESRYIYYLLSSFNSIFTISSFSVEYAQIKPGLFALTNLVEVQVSFAAIRVSRQEYVFIPKLRAICLLNRVVETVSILLLLSLV